MTQLLTDRLTDGSRAGRQTGGRAGGRVGRLGNNLEFSRLVSMDYVLPKSGDCVRGDCRWDYVREGFGPGGSCSITLRPTSAYSTQMTDHHILYFTTNIVI